MGNLFGTDGIRGKFGVELTCSLAFYCGTAIANLKKKCKIIIGRDNRPSGKVLANSLSFGALKAGAEVVDVGIVTTPCISFLAKEYQFDFGVVISASHNRSEYNGIKIFNHLGEKINDDTQHVLEKLLYDFIEADKKGGRSKTDKVAQNNLDFCQDKNEFKNMAEHGMFSSCDIRVCPKYSRSRKLINCYIDYLVQIGRSLKNKHFAVDCANGASTFIAKKVFAKLGADVKFVGTGGGDKINLNCGAVYPQKMFKIVNKYNLDFGFCFDGDADRIVLVTKTKIYDGDNILCYLSRGQKVIVSTIMSNLGLEKALESRNCVLKRTDVGDRNVSVEMDKLGAKIGGEQSGHIILKDYMPTGDGLLTAIVLCRQFDKSTLEKYLEFEAYPQAKINVNVKNKDTYLSKAAYIQIENTKNILKGCGRVIVRASGTENVVRVMVETKDYQLSKELAQKIAKFIK